MIHTDIIAHTGPTNAQMKLRSVDSQQLYDTTVHSQSDNINPFGTRPVNQPTNINKDTSCITISAYNYSNV